MTSPSSTNRTVSAPLAGRTMLVTGASSGIGRAIAVAMARAGADVALTYARNVDGARETMEAIKQTGRRAAAFPLDLADAPQLTSTLDKLVDGVTEAFGRIDGWVNNAGADILTGTGAHLSDQAKLDHLIAVDLRGTVVASWRAVALMKGQDRGGVIINMSWDHVITGMEGRNPEMFAAVKGGVMSFSKSLARSVAPQVRVNILAPGWIETAFAKSLDPARYRTIATTTPLGRWGTPEDVANAAVYLASPAAEFLTGHTIFVNGGAVMA